MKRILVVLVVVALFLGALGVWFTQNQTSVVQADTERRSMPIRLGDIVSTVSATGNLEAEEEIDLSFEMTGIVEEVFVKRGQAVEAGDPLAKLDTTRLELEVAQTEVSLGEAKTELAQVQDNVDPDDLASARAGLASAQAKYNGLLAGSSEDEITVAAADLRTAEVTLADAQGNYDRVAYKGGVGASQEAMALQEATINHAKALANYNLAIEGADDEELKAAEADISSAQATLNNLLQGSSDEEIALGESKVRSAQLSLDSAMRDVEEATLFAPIDATVTAVNIQKGERTTEGDAGNVAIVLTDLDPLHIDVEIDEIDVPLIDVGQPAVISVDALPDSSLSGAVSEIAPAPVSVDDGVVTYEIAVTLNEQSTGARQGMTANVNIETERREGVLVIPSVFIQVDADTGMTFVEQPGPEGEAVRTEITLGDRSDQVVEIVDGLEEGDMVLMPEMDLSQMTGAGSNRGGFPRPPGMMGRPPGGGPPGGVPH
jgi:HlyD family secretion protein